MSGPSTSPHKLMMKETSPIEDRGVLSKPIPLGDQSCDSVCMVALQADPAYRLEIVIGTGTSDHKGVAAFSGACSCNSAISLATTSSTFSRCSSPTSAAARLSGTVAGA